MEGVGPRTLYALGIAAYGLATVHGTFLWRRGLPRGEWVSYGLIAAGFAPHTAALVGRGFSLNQCPVTNLFEAVMFVTWVMVGAYLLGGRWDRLRFSGLLLAPVVTAAGIFALQPPLDRSGPGFEVEHAALSLHVTLVLLAYAAFGMASLAGGLYLIRDSAEIGASGGPGRWTTPLPSGERLERVLGRSLSAGLILLTAGLVMSFGLMRERYGVLARPDPKIAWSIFVWLVYLGLVVVQLQFRPSGRRVAWGAVVGFAFVVLTFWGTNLLSPIHHP